MPRSCHLAAATPHGDAPDRLRRSGAGPLRDDDREQHSVREAGRDAGGDRGGRAAGERARFHRKLCGRECIVAKVVEVGPFDHLVGAHTMYASFPFHLYLRDTTLRSAIRVRSSVVRL